MTMQKPQEISTAAKLIYITILATFILDIYKVWTGKIGIIESVISWFIYLLIALIPYGLIKGKKSARTWYCVCVALSLVFIVLFIFYPSSMSPLRWWGSGITAMLDIWILLLLFSPAASAWLERQS